MHDKCNSYFSFWDIFCTFKIKILKKLKKTPQDIITLHMCTKNHDHMMVILKCGAQWMDRQMDGRSDV